MSPRTHELQACPRCQSPLVYPELAHGIGHGHWCVALRCPNCEWAQSRMVGDELMELLDRELDRGTAVLTRDLRWMEQLNMADFVDRFVAALNADALQPMDF